MAAWTPPRRLAKYRALLNLVKAYRHELLSNQYGLGLSSWMQLPATHIAGLATIPTNKLMRALLIATSMSSACADIRYNGQDWVLHDPASDACYHKTCFGKAHGPQGLDVGVDDPYR